MREGFLISIILCLASAVAGHRPIHNVLNYGAMGDGNTDDTQAFLKTWKAACGDHNGSVLLVTGKGTRKYLLGKIEFTGPCLSDVNFQIDGELVAPNKLWTNEIDTWIQFRNVPGISVYGHGSIDGRGFIWWNCLSKNQCRYAPYTMEFMGCNGLKVNGLSFKDSPGKHLVVYKSNDSILTGLHITAPEDSPNTDGILISDSQHVIITQSTIGVGDDCIAIGPRCYDVNVSNINCGPGHGISIGSLGENGAEDIVEHIHVSDCNISNTLTGVRIKTWQGGAGHAKFLSYSNINFNSVRGSIIVLDQYYCPHSTCPNKTGNVAISDVSYKGLHGSSTSDVAIKLACSSSVPCHGITMDEVSFFSTNANHPLLSYCINAVGSSTGNVRPDVPCLQR
ncbi:hypothetical protein HPP92_003779 [Vanilla planifolia]|uniref:Polygalacturonase n=1 Tax=Vanilla planifolia TaxID=51239 RepID=A0A835VJ89_VANPL|nr:hypothetical protein HPP92_003779 [Vanilla planifolia]